MDLTASFDTVVIANGEFPTHPLPLRLLHNAKHLVCCDGAIQKLLAAKLEPEMIVGDFDSMPNELRTRFADRLTHIAEQETNDLTKTVTYCINHGYKKIAIVGATGLREDHTLGNISLLCDYASLCDEVAMFTDYGIFRCLTRSGETIPTYKGQQVSLFTFPNTMQITTHGLKYSVNNGTLNSWWNGTLNEAESTSFSIDFNNGKLLIYLVY